LVEPKLAEGRDDTVPHRRSERIRATHLQRDLVEVKDGGEAEEGDEESLIDATSTPAGEEGAQKKCLPATQSHDTTQPVWEKPTPRSSQRVWSDRTNARGRTASTTLSAIRNVPYSAESSKLVEPKLAEGRDDTVLHRRSERIRATHLQRDLVEVKDGGEAEEGDEESLIDATSTPAGEEGAQKKCLPATQSHDTTQPVWEKPTPRSSQRVWSYRTNARGRTASTTLSAIRNVPYSAESSKLVEPKLAEGRDDTVPHRRSERIRATHLQRDLVEVKDGGEAEEGDEESDEDDYCYG
jgi:hypothetical protein